MNQPLLYLYNAIPTKEPQFKLGVVVVTRAIKNLMNQSQIFSNEIEASFNKFIQKDWGIAPLNSKGKPYGVKNGDTIFGKYQTTEGIIYIVTEYDRSYTVIMLPEEY